MYSREEILSMPAGQNLDELVAIHAMGRENNKTPQGHKPFCPSRDIAAAWEVVVKIGEVRIEQYVAQGIRKYRVFMNNGGQVEVCLDDSAPLAISKCALLSLLKED